MVVILGADQRDRGHGLWLGKLGQSILPAGDGVVGFNVGGSSVGLVLQYSNHACWMSLVLSPRVFPRLVSPFLRAIVVRPFMLKARES